MECLAAAVEAVKEANDVLASHAGKKHRHCRGCLDVGVLLLVAEEALEEAMADLPSTVAPA
jgi:hypothetical protein